MLKVILFSDKPELKLEEALQDAAAWVSRQTHRKCEWSLTRKPAMPLGSDPYKAVVEWLVDVEKYPPGRYVILARGIGGYAGGAKPRDGYGVGLLGDWCLDGVTLQPWSPDVHTWVKDAGRKGQIGALIHEWLHGYGLWHEDGGVMLEWWKWPETSIPPCPALLRDLPPLPTEPLPWYRKLWRWILG